MISDTMNVAQSFQHLNTCPTSKNYTFFSIWALMNTRELFDSLLPIFTLWFMFIYIFGYFIIFKNWPSKYKSEASSCLMSLVHGTPAVVFSIFSISKSRKIIITSPNTAFQNSVLEYSIAYFLIDLLHYIVFIPSDVLLIAHHLGTLYVLMTCRYLFGHGAVAILGILVLAEVTSACQNTWSLARYRRDDSLKAARLFEFLSPLFYGYYSVVRGVLGPVFVYKIGVVFGSGVGDGVIPRWAWMSWMVVIVIAIGLSVLWVLHLWVDLYRERTEKRVKKSS